MELGKLTKQQKKVLGWLLNGERITQQTGDKRGVGRVTSRIHDLRKKFAMPIRDRYITITKTTTGEKTKIKEYWMKREDIANIKTFSSQPRRSQGQGNVATSSRNEAKATEPGLKQQPPHAGAGW